LAGGADGNEWGRKNKKRRTEEGRMRGGIGPTFGARLLPSVEKE